MKIGKCGALCGKIGKSEYLNQTCGSIGQLCDSRSREATATLNLWLIFSLIRAIIIKSPINWRGGRAVECGRLEIYFRAT